MSEALQSLMGPLTKVCMLGVASFFLAMAITPIYTYFAYKYKFWKQMRHEAMSGGEAKVYEKLHAAKHKRHIPTMAGIIFVVRRQAQAPHSYYGRHHFCGGYRHCDVTTELFARTDLVAISSLGLLCNRWLG